MKVIFPCAYYIPEKAASMYITSDIVHACAENGVEVFLYAPTPTRNVPKGTAFKRKEDLCNGLLHIKRFHMFSEGTSPVLRAFRYFLCEIVQLHYCLWKNYDIAFVDSTPPIQGLKLGLVKLFRNKPVIFNAQDIFPDSLVGTGLAKRGSLLWEIGRIVEKITYQNSDKIIVISDDLRKNIISKGVTEDKIELIYNWVDENKVVPVSREENRLFDELGLSRKPFYVVYAGNLGHAQNIDIIIEAASELSTRENIKFVIFGSGGSEKELKGKAAKLNLNNLVFFPIQPSERISEVYSMGDAAIVTCKPGLGKSAMPSKTWSIMSSGTAILANFDEDTELQRIIETQKLGLFSKSGDVGKLCETIVKLYENTEQTIEFGKNGRNFILKNLTKEIGTSKYVDVMNNLIKNIGK